MDAGMEWEEWAYAPVQLDDRFREAAEEVSWYSLIAQESVDIIFHGLF